MSIFTGGIPSSAQDLIKALDREIPRAVIDKPVISQEDMENLRWNAARRSLVDDLVNAFTRQQSESDMFITKERKR